MRRMTMIVLVSWLSCMTIQGQTPTFTRENVVFRLDSAHLTVVSDLYFQNDRDQSISTAVFFPYSCEGHIAKVDTVTILDVNSNSYIKPARKTLAGVLFQLPFTPREQKRLKITYIQDHDGKLAGYVVTKVKYWQGQVQANYTLNVTCPQVKIDSTAFKPDKITEEGGKPVYTWHKTNFKPDKEFCIWFHLQ
jgi:hypothetical protein